MTKKITVIVPAYNEERFLELNIMKIHTLLEKYYTDFEIIISEDGSVDETKNICIKLSQIEKIRSIHFQDRLGKGKAIKNALEVASGQVIVIIDADLPVDPVFIPNLIEALEDGNDLVIGSRYMPGSKTRRNFYSTLKSILYNFMVRMVFSTDILDHQCGFKAFKSNHLGNILSEIKTDNFFYDTDLIVRAKNQKHKIKEIPIEWSEPSGRISHVKLRDEIEILLQMKKYIINNSLKKNRT